jgi:hypothetical protein
MENENKSLSNQGETSQLKTKISLAGRSIQLVLIFMKGSTLILISSGRK